MRACFARARKVRLREEQQAAYAARLSAFREQARELVQEHTKGPLAIKEQDALAELAVVAGVGELASLGGLDELLENVQIASPRRGPTPQGIEEYARAGATVIKCQEADWEAAAHGQTMKGHALFVVVFKSAVPDDAAAEERAVREAWENAHRAGAAGPQMRIFEDGLPMGQPPAFKDLVALMQLTPPMPLIVVFSGHTFLTDDGVGFTHAVKRASSSKDPFGFTPVKEVIQWVKRAHEAAEANGAVAHMPTFLILDGCATARAPGAGNPELHWPKTFGLEAENPASVAAVASWETKEGPTAVGHVTSPPNLDSMDIVMGALPCVPTKAYAPE